MADGDMITSAALSNLGADLSVSISFSVANELVAAARESQIGNDELVALLVTIVVVVTSAKRFVDRLSTTLAVGNAKRIADGTPKETAADATGADGAASATAADGAVGAASANGGLDGSMPEEGKHEPQRGLLEFTSLMLSIAQRIALSISVQVLAYSVKANQPSRVVRVTTLLGVVVFFVFFESAATRRS